MQKDKKMVASLLNLNIAIFGKKINQITKQCKRKYTFTEFCQLKNFWGNEK